MSKLIDICVQVDPAYGSPHVIIKTDKRSPLIEKIIDAIERCTEEEDPDVVCYSDDIGRIDSSIYYLVSNTKWKVLCR